MKKALVTQCQRQESDREVDWDPAEGECYVRGVGNRGEAFNICGVECECERGGEMTCETDGRLR